MKFWVDQQVCPSCQKWMLVEVISHLKQLAVPFGKLIVELYAEVRFMGVDHKIRVQRSAVWPVAVGLTANFADLPVDYNA